MLIELYSFFFFVRQYHQVLKQFYIKSWRDTHKCLHRVGLCVQQIGQTRVVHWTEAEWVCVFVLNAWLAALVSAAKKVLQHCCRSRYSLVNKVRVWLATWQSDYSYLCFIAELKWTSKVSAEKALLPWLSFSYPTSGHVLVQNCQHLVFCCKDSWHIAYSHNSQAEHWHEAKTLTEPFKLCIQ